MKGCKHWKDGFCGILERDCIYDDAGSDDVPCVEYEAREVKDHGN